MKIKELLLVLFLPLSILAQNENTPSELLIQLSEAKEDTLITTLYRQLGESYYTEKYDSAYYYFNKGLAIARAYGIQSEIGYLLTSKSRVIIYEGKYNDAVDTLKKALNIYKKEQLKDACATVYTNIGVVFYNKSQYDSCKYYWNESLKIYKEIKDSSGIATIYANIGVVNYVQGNAEAALSNYLKSLEIREKANTTSGLASLYMKIALIYQKHFLDYVKSYEYVNQAVKLYRSENNKLGVTQALINKGNTLDLLDSTKSALKIFNQALISAEEIGNKRLLATLYSLLGNKLTDKHEYKKALDYLYKARDFNIEMEQIRELGIVYERIGRVFQELADFNTALSYFQKSLELAEELKLHSSMSVLYELMSNVAAKMGDYKKAYGYYKNYMVEKDSVSAHENKKHLAEMEAKYTNEQNQQKIKFLEKDQQNKDEQIRTSIVIRNLLIGMALLVLAVAILFYQRFRHKTILNTELKKRNEEIANANKEIQANASNIEKYNKLLLEKNKIIQRQNAEMLEINNTKDRLFSIIGHDLRSPMSGIQTSLSLLQNKKFSSEKVEYIYQLMDNDIKAALDLLENLLVWAKNQEGKMKLIKQNHSFNKVAEKVISSVKTIAQSKNISLKFSPADNDDAYFDQSMISAVLRNLLVNSLKFTTSGGEIIVTASHENEILRVTVLDNGIGMDKDTLEKIQKKGSYYTRPGTNKEKGSGLGLAICFDIIDMHNGALEIESQVDKGSSFTFAIPLKSK